MAVVAVAVLAVLLTFAGIGLAAFLTYQLLVKRWFWW